MLNILKKPTFLGMTYGEVLFWVALTMFAMWFGAKIL